jgi:hypothetical protein
MACPRVNFTFTLLYKLSLSPYFGFGVLHGVKVKVVDDVSETTVGPNFTGQESRALKQLILEVGLHVSFVSSRLLIYVNV